MTTINEFIDGFPLLAIETLLRNIKEKLQADFDYSINADAKTVIIFKVPEKHKAEIWSIITDQGFTAKEN
ncbi:hypothetical protein [Mucilaginibacter sp. SJ]|uniref:hypothetical protein n=1 Tax=Mucilaginibacter sp. SJ TaxID=3029053 RepID=UPI0023A94EF2|nr:hypothetical protein [Mucilaginibacter sp. SJ]WEA00827.1 hypothetical protein MusilaSJ_25570 [Mucilaginibacter sp. SJ]